MAAIIVKYQTVHREHKGEKDYTFNIDIPGVRREDILSIETLSPFRIGVYYIDPEVRIQEEAEYKKWRDERFGVVMNGQGAFFLPKGMLHPGAGPSWDSIALTQEQVRKQYELWKQSNQK